MHTSICLARILRDLFQSSSHYILACNSLTLQSALPQLLKDTGNTGIVWQQVEQDFIRLFVGADAVAPPHAGRYLQCYVAAEGGNCISSHDVFCALGLEMPSLYFDDSDHISMELDGWLCMGEMIRSSATPYQVANLRAAQRWLLWAHMGTWVPVFVRHCLCQPDLPFPLRHALHALEFWLRLEMSNGEYMRAG